ncbi:toxin-antitoxin addiction module toxin component MazF [Secundilactobacillus pentosiphilus]|uniref:mRNA interferase n=1 Tax=Secundilactobacillus pentosiphilus TaxID=1714682 RepID=A0A1Z5IZQ6_9LACO|nr:type II toxin-antitoxin system PemK/MazF family toxin [Secundilactobacillus pentosiphilus]GAX07253.1 toxin-antitoxin addiction module toxin component MazF [Secundilactobacillus pentosiphilus]
MQLHQGDIITVNFKDTEGHEQRGQRPALVVSDDHYNRFTRTVKVVAITSHGTDFPLHVVLPAGLQTFGQVLTEQERSIDPQAREVEFIERCPQEVLDKVLDLVTASY